MKMWIENSSLKHTDYVYTDILVMSFTTLFIYGRFTVVRVAPVFIQKMLIQYIGVKSILQQVLT